MAELPEIWGPRLPERRPLYDRPATFGVARDAERMRQGVPPPAIRRGPTRRGAFRQIPPAVDRDHPLDHRLWQCRSRAREVRLYGRTWTHFRNWWSTGDNRPADVWHGLRCRRGHHDFRGGHAMQLGSNMVHVERRCVWCDAPPF